MRQIILGFAVIVTGAVIAACGGGNAEPTPTATSSETASPTPTPTPTRIPTPTTIPEVTPQLGRIVFSSTRDHAKVEIYVMDPDGSNLTRLTNNPAVDAAPVCSPDGTKIAFMSFRDDEFEIYIMDADGSHQTRLTNNTAFDARPAWSPDGRRITFFSDRDSSPASGSRFRNMEIYVMNADGSNQTGLTNTPVTDESPDWSPDGRRITFTSGTFPDSEIL